MECDNETMIVIIDGEKEYRKIDCYNKVSRRHEPVLREGEECMWTIGSHTPIIVRRLP